MPLTATQKTRLTLTGSPDGIPAWPHEGPDVVRWLTGGSLPDLRVTFEDDPTFPEQKRVRCASCQQIIGFIPADFNAFETAPAFARIRQHHTCR